MNRSILARFLAHFVLLAPLAACNAGSVAAQPTETADAGQAAKPVACHPGEQAGMSAAGVRQIRMCIRSGSHTAALTVEVADTEPLQERGLMLRSSLDDDKGMIFLFDEPKVASFWMKNTLIPLDMIFIRADGTVANVAAQTTPYSLTPVFAKEPVTAVLEVRGGRAAELGIAAGSFVRWQ